MNIETLLHEEIVYEMGTLRDLDVGSDEHKKAVEDVAHLMDRAIEMEKLAADGTKSVDDKKDRLIKNITNVASIVIPTVVTIWGTLKSFEFEKEGTVTTIMGRGFINKLLPKK